MATLTDPGRPDVSAAECVVAVLPSGSEPGHPELSLRAGLLAPRLLSCGPGWARVALVATTATLLAGDAMRLRVEVGQGQRLELVDVAGTVAYDGRGGQARWEVAVVVGPGAVLLWHGEPLVVSTGADVVRTLSLQVAVGGRVLARDRVVLGRHGERGGNLLCRTRVWHGGEPLLAEDLDLRDLPGGGRRLPGVVGRHRVLDTVSAFGWEPAVPADVADGPGTVPLQLAGAGTLVRALAEEAHRSPVGRLWRRWAADLDAAAGPSARPGPA